MPALKQNVVGYVFKEDCEVETFVAQWLPSRDTSVCQQKVEKFVSPKINASILKELSGKIGDSGAQLNLGCEL